MLVSSYKGEYIAKALENCLLEWGIKNVFTVIVDNASSNDTALSFFLKKNYYLRVPVLLWLNMYMSDVLHIF